MNNEMNDKLFLAGRAHYGEAFWKAMRGNDAASPILPVRNIISPTPICSRRARPPSILRP